MLLPSASAPRWLRQCKGCSMGRCLNRRPHPTSAITYTRPPCCLSVAVKTQMQEQQLHARIAVLQQQAQSAVAAASKTQREVRRSRDTGPQLCTLLHAAVCRVQQLLPVAAWDHAVPRSELPSALKRIVSAAMHHAWVCAHVRRPAPGPLWFLCDALALLLGRSLGAQHCTCSCRHASFHYVLTATCSCTG